jgi:hypothetical protein
MSLSLRIICSLLYALMAVAVIPLFFIGVMALGGKQTEYSHTLVVWLGRCLELLPLTCLLAIIGINTHKKYFYHLFPLLNLAAVIVIFIIWNGL